MIFQREISIILRLSKFGGGLVGKIGVVGLEFRFGSTRVRICDVNIGVCIRPMVDVGPNKDEPYGFPKKWAR